MARVDQRLRAESSLTPGKSKCHCRRVEPLGSLQLLASYKLTGKESSTRVLPNLSLFNLTLTPTLRAEIIAAQKDGEGMGHIKRRMLEGDPKVACFREDAQGTL
jgi:hypothetical protein